MKKILCLLVVLTFIPGLRADNNKKKNSSNHPAPAATHSGGNKPAAGSMHMPGSPGGAHQNTSHPGNHINGPHTGSTHSGTSANNSMSHHTTGGAHDSETTTKGTSSSNPLSRRGGQAQSGTNNPLTQNSHPAGTKGNPMTQKGGNANNSNPMSHNAAQANRNLGGNAANHNFANQHAAHFNGAAQGHTYVHAAHANYHVRPYREVFHNYHAVYHDRAWYGTHYDRVVVLGGGYYYWDAGYWYPAWGYDPGFSAYVYDGPIYSYNNLPPDEVIVNVQTQLQDEGYYTGEVDGQLGPQTRDAIGAYQSDHDLEVTSAVDEPTVEALGLVEST